MATITGTSSNDTLTGTGADDVITGLAGDDTLTGAGGSDAFAYTARNFHDDVITDFTLGQDRIDLAALGIGDFLTIQPFMTQAGPDTVITFGYGSASETITIRNVLPGQLAAANFIFNTSTSGLTVNGGSFSDVLFGGLGNDTINASGGNDKVTAGLGNDTLIGEGGNDTLTGGAGNDIFAYNARNFSDDIITDFTLGQDRIDLSYLGVGDFLTIQPFLSQAGADTVISFGYGTASETITIRNVLPGQLSAANFIFNTSTTGLTVNGGGFSDVLFGGLGNDTINAGSGNDTLTAGLGNDTLIGESGNDTLTGAAGNDIFAYTARNFSDDVITDFTLGQDRIDLSYLGIGDFITIQPFISQSGADTVITFGYGTASETITLKNIAPAQLSAANFIFNSTTSGLTVNGGAFSDVLFGGLGNDTINASSGNDTITAGAGNDTLIGESGNDTLTGAAGNDIFAYTARNFHDDVITDFTLGQDRIDLSYLGIGDFLTIQPFISQVGADSVLTFGYGSGAESVTLKNVAAYQLSAANFVFNTLTTGQTVAGGSFSDVLFGGLGNDTINANGGNDTLTAGAGNDTLNGGTGNDMLIGGIGGDVLDGGDGRDTVSYANSTSGLTIDLTTPGNNTGEAAGDSYIGIESLVATAFSDTITGTGYADEVWASTGDDIIRTWAGTDALYGGDGNDTLEGGLGADWLDGGNGRDVAVYGNAAAGVTIDTNNVANNAGEAAGDTFVSIEAFVGSAFADTMTGTGGNDEFWGQAGNDFLRGWAGNDGLIGGVGADNLEGGLGADWLDGGDGIDIASYGNAAAGVRASLANRAVNSGDAAGDVFIGVEGLSGSAFGDDLIGDSNANQLWGAGGADVLWGQVGNDELYGNEGDDWLVGGIGADKIDGGNGVDTVRYSYAATGLRADLQDFWGNTGDAAGDTYYGIENIVGSDYADFLLGDNSANEVWGDYGDDHIWGRGGNDVLAGGNGVDTFHFTSGWGADRLLDYKVGGAEKLSFDGIAGLTSFSQLTLTDAAAGLTVSYGGNSILLQGIHTLSAGDCLF